MDPNILANIPMIREVFGILPGGEMKDGTRALLSAMTQMDIAKGQDIVRYGADNEDGMYIIIRGKADVFDGDGRLINTLKEGDFIGELGLINDDGRVATVRAATDMVCANISRPLFDEIAGKNRRIYGSFMQMLYTKTTRLVTERERIRSELSIAAQIQTGLLEKDFSSFSKLPDVKLHARMRPAREVGGDFYDVFLIDDNRLAFLIADVSGKGVPAALFMSMAKTHIKNYASLGLPLSEVAWRANGQLCQKNDAQMFVTVFLCVLDIRTDEVTFVNAGHNLPFVLKGREGFEMISARVNLVLGTMEGIPYREQRLTLKKGDAIFLYTDGVTEALNPAQELLGNDRLKAMLNAHKELAASPEDFVEAILQDVDAFAKGEEQADDITMVYLTRV